MCLAMGGSFARTALQSARKGDLQAAENDLRQAKVWSKDDGLESSQASSIKAAEEAIATLKTRMEVEAKAREEETTRKAKYADLESDLTKLPSRVAARKMVGK